MVPVLFWFHYTCCTMNHALVSSRTLAQQGHTTTTVLCSTACIVAQGHIANVVVALYDVLILVLLLLLLYCTTTVLLLPLYCCATFCCVVVVVSVLRCTLFSQIQAESSSSWHAPPFCYLLSIPHVEQGKQGTFFIFFNESIGHDKKDPAEALQLPSFVGLSFIVNLLEHATPSPCW